MHSGMSVDEYVAYLNGMIAHEHLIANGAAEDWANESHHFAEAALVGNGAQIDENYYRMQITIVDERLALAGLRLAATLNDVWLQPQ